MASDTLNQAGKMLGKTKKDSDFTIRRTREEFPAVEHIVDAFDATDGFYMEFKTQRAENNVRLTIILKENFDPCA